MIRTNNVSRPLLSGWELTDDERKEFDYIERGDWEETCNRFFRYRGQVYDTREFTRIVPGGQPCPGFSHIDHTGVLAGWDGILTESFFSGIVVKYTDDFESIVVGLLTF